MFQVKMRIMKLLKSTCSVGVVQKEADEWGRDSQHSRGFRPILHQSIAWSSTFIIYSFIWQISFNESHLVTASKNTDVVLGNHVIWQEWKKKKKTGLALYSVG